MTIYCSISEWLDLRCWCGFHRENFISFPNATFNQHKHISHFPFLLKSGKLRETKGKKQTYQTSLLAILVVCSGDRFCAREQATGNDVTSVPLCACLTDCDLWMLRVCGWLIDGLTDWFTRFLFSLRSSCLCLVAFHKKIYLAPPLFLMLTQR